MTPTPSKTSPCLSSAQVEADSPIWQDQRQWIDLAASEVETTDQRVIQRLCDLPQHFGNDPMDVWQGIWNIAQNSDLALCETIPDSPPLSMPAIAIGAGPSLDDSLDDLRVLQHHCVLIACNTAIHGLLDHGIVPHYMACVERDHGTVLTVTKRVDGITYAGLPLVGRPLVERFRNRLLVGSPHGLLHWAYPELTPTSCGSSAGTQAVGLAQRLTSGPIYLVGHDLAYRGDQSHAGIHHGARIADTSVEVPGASGPVMTSRFWMRLLNEMRSICSDTPERIMNVANAQGHGAVIYGVAAGALPNPASLPPFERCQSWGNTAQADRAYALKRRVQRLPSILRAWLKGIQQATDYEATTCSTIIRNRGDAGLVAAIMISIYAQVSMERRLGREAVALDWLKCAGRNVVNGLLPMVEELARVTR